ncbi:MAG: hypothetical protein JWL69_3407, partial [Phycisphaerales bacterium]|nr:hypothetical protein [Phycisphaerales bacterium]
MLLDVQRVVVVDVELGVAPDG